MNIITRTIRRLHARHHEAARDDYLLYVAYAASQGRELMASIYHRKATEHAIEAMRLRGFEPPPSFENTPVFLRKQAD